MFTGLIEEIGVVSVLTAHDPTTSGGNGTSLTITHCPLILSDAKLGDSISINGTCLTITSLSPSSSASPSNTPRPTNPGDSIPTRPRNPTPATAATGGPLSFPPTTTATTTTTQPPPRSGSATALPSLDAESSAASSDNNSSQPQPSQLQSQPQSPPASFKVGISPETLRRTNLGELTEGSRVNLERALKGEVRMGGHFVQGHVDCVAEIVGLRREGNMVVYRFSAKGAAAGETEGGYGDGSGDVMRYVVEKGYVGLDGASLTVTAVGGGGRGGGRGGGKGGDGERGWWEVMLIPYTRERVVMGEKEIGGSVNVEVDMVGKYVERSVRGFLQGGAEGLPGLEEVVRKVVREEMQGMGIEGGGRGLVEG